MNDLMTKSFTSYVDLKKSAMKDIDLEAGSVEICSTTAMDSDLGLFLEEVEKIKQEMASVREILVKLQQANEESKSLHKSDDLKTLRDRINSDIIAVLKKSRKIRSDLEAMDRANTANRRISGSPAHRTRLAVTGGLRQKLRDLMMEFQALRQRMMSEYKETVGRRYFTVTGEHADEAAIDEIVADGGEEFLRRAIRSETGRGKVEETVTEIQDRADAAREIERSLLELHQVFLDMAVLVESQGEKMDDIEQHVLSAKNYVGDGNKQLLSAKKYQRGNRKWMCIGVILLLVVFLVVFIPIATTFSHS